MTPKTYPLWAITTALALLAIAVNLHIEYNGFLFAAYWIQGFQLGRLLLLNKRETLFDFSQDLLNVMIVFCCIVATCILSKLS